MSSVSRSSDDPLRALARRRRILRAAGAAGLAPLALWALFPGSPVTGAGAAPPPPQTGALDAEVAAAPLDPAAFDVELWFVEPSEAPAEIAPSSDAGAERLTVQLVGIVQEGAAQKAALYDPVEDRLHLVARGATIQGHVLTQITPAAVRLTRGRRVETLELAAR